eukprot:7402050-Alexandrium_andersonii.AAC.1
MESNARRPGHSDRARCEVPRTSHPLDLCWGSCCPSHAAPEAARAMSRHPGPTTSQRRLHGAIDTTTWE